MIIVDIDPSQLAVCLLLNWFGSHLRLKTRATVCLTHSNSQNVIVILRSVICTKLCRRSIGV